MSEYQNLDLNTLVDLLAQKTLFYIRLIKEEGFSERAGQCKETILNIQAAIESKKYADKKPNGNNGNNLKKDNTASPE
jgi:hypothetical protein